MTSVAIETVGPHVCVRLLKPGQVKRCMHRGPLVGYYIACPHCGFKATYLHDDVGYVEERAVEGSEYPKRLIGITHPPTCFRCHRRIRVVGREIEAS